MWTRPIDYCLPITLVVLMRFGRDLSSESARLVILQDNYRSNGFACVIKVEKGQFYYTACWIVEASCIMQASGPIHDNDQVLLVKISKTANRENNRCTGWSMLQSSRLCFKNFPDWELNSISFVMKMTDNWSFSINALLLLQLILLCCNVIARCRRRSMSHAALALTMHCCRFVSVVSKFPGRLYR